MSENTTQTINKYVEIPRQQRKRYIIQSSSRRMKSDNNTEIRQLPCTIW